jgi:hypothetical protein
VCIDAASWCPCRPCQRWVPINDSSIISGPSTTSTRTVELVVDELLGKFVMENPLRLSLFSGLAVKQIGFHHDHRKDGNLYSLRPVMCLNFSFQHESILAAPIVLIDQTASRMWDKELCTVWRCVLFLTLSPPIPAVSFASLKARPSCNKVAVSISIHPNKCQQRRLSITSPGQQPYTVPTIS